MATVTAGAVASIFCPLASTITVTPGAQAVVRVENPNGADSFDQTRIGAEQAFTVAAGETMFIEAVGSDLTYTGTVSIETPDGGVYALSEVTPYVNLTATGTAFTGACELAGFDCTAVTGSPTITIYDNTSAAGTVIVPATTLTVGRTEFAYKRALTTGCHVVLSGTQTVNVLVG